jgi:hypothetical protein
MTRSPLRFSPLRPACLGLLMLLSGAAAAGIKLPAGAVVDLELQQTLSSAYTDTTAPVYFRVKDDVRGEDHVLIRSGTLVQGRIVNAQGQQRMAQNGSFTYDVHFVPAVDGQNIRVIAGATRAGRDRSGALTTGMILWGVFGLLTHGANAWIERGAILEAQVLSDRMIDVDKEIAPTPAPVDAWHAASKGHHFDFTAARVIELNLEKSRKLDTVRIEFLADPSTPLAGAEPLHWQLVALDGAPLPRPIDELSGGAKGAVFDSWALLQYCHEGDNVAGFRAVLPDSTAVDAQDTIAVHFAAKR